MKRILLMALLCLVTAWPCLADSWTDTNGVTWRFSVYTNYSPVKVWIDGATATTSSVTLPTTVTAEDGNSYKVTDVELDWFIDSGITDLIINSTDTVSFVYTNNTKERAVTVHVPADMLATYKALGSWQKAKRQLVAIGAQTDYTLDVTAQDNASSFYSAIGEDNFDNVETLKVSGTINGHDISYIRNKMYNLHNLDLTDATIVANDFKYYGDYCSVDSVLTPYAFYDLPNLVSVKLPKNLKGEIGHDAFQNCYNLKEVTIPDGVTDIGEEVFWSCALHTVTLPESIISIDRYAFYGCPLQEISLPEDLRSLGYGAFVGTNLKKVVLPEALDTIEGQAFNGVSSLTDIYTTRFTPISIPDDAFSNAGNCNLWAPYKKAATDESEDWDAVYMAYYDHAQWGKFMEVKRWEDYTYKKITLGENDDFTQKQGSAPTTDQTAADFGTGSGYTNASKDDQVLDTITVHSDGTDAASIIADDNIDANGLKFDIKVDANRWYFFCFPFDIKLSDITCGGHYVFRQYDGAARAQGGSGWSALPDTTTTLKAWKGYIFQTDTPGKLLLNVAKEAFGKFSKEDRRPELTSHQTNNVENASWNFMGNPWTSYYDIDDMGYDAPITYWDGSNYQTVRPGDDDYMLHPFEAFFVQKPEAVDNITFGGDHRYTKTGAGKHQAAAKRMRLERGINPDRLLVNLTLTDGTTVDKTRVVYNNNVSADYEIGTDAAKFSAGGSVSLYTVDTRGHHYAINERPVGEVHLAYTSRKAGELTLTVVRMDTPLLLRDAVTGTTFDLSNGGYTFDTDAGTFENRFTIVQNATATGIADVQAKTGVKISAADGGIYFNGIGSANVSIYTLGGTLTTSDVRNGFVALPQGTYVVRVDAMSVKVVVR